MSGAMYFEDLAVGRVLDFGSYHVEAEDMVAFARKWDALPIHLEADGGTAAPYGGLIASGEYTMAVKQYLLSRHPIGKGVIGTLGYDEVRFPKPVRAGDTLHLAGECVEARASRSKPDRGVVKLRIRIANQMDEPVLTYTDIVLMARRPAQAETE